MILGRHFLYEYKYIDLIIVFYYFSKLPPVRELILALTAVELLSLLRSLNDFCLVFWKSWGHIHGAFEELNLLQQHLWVSTVSLAALLAIIISLTPTPPSNNCSPTACCSWVGSSSCSGTGSSPPSPPDQIVQMRMMMVVIVVVMMMMVIIFMSRPPSPPWEKWSR